MDSPTPIPAADIEDKETLVFGDLEMYPGIRDTVRALEPDVRSLVNRHVVFLAVGRDSAGWTSSSRLLDGTGRAREILIVLGPATTPELIRHEVAHALERLRRGGAGNAVSCPGEIGLREYAARAGFADRLTAYVRDEERRAELEAAALAAQ